MRIVGQWDGHAVENMSGGGLNLKEDKIPKCHACLYSETVTKKNQN